ncbi:putative replication initiation protein [Calanoida sp. copepod associated circular virus]|uniref:putative replication initiation protein n=1 Tax=Calanoida sp. copepod associated circular virus TaxID=1692244 RepID=UPI0006A6A792|nr:putative replication initiation protein [Calanoida sp. copepod associated circular virus]AKV62292.1 putative replication initiation protein [Calanoida sp. copepod associated circular virus]
MVNSGKHWCFTLNNYTPEEESSIKLVDAVYLVYGRERGESDTPHLQGFVSFDKRRTLRQVKELLSDRVHLESAKGTPRQASEYCKKDGDYYEVGILPGGRGTRTDLESVRELIKSGGSIRDVFDKHFGVALRYHRGISMAINLRGDKREWVVDVQVYWGDTGSGKTKKAWTEAPDAYVHPGGQWFDGYTGQPDVIFDDFSGSEFKLTYLLKLLDRYPMQVPVKGGFVNWVPKRIFITSNLDPRTWYKDAIQEHQAALMRRITKITHFTIPFH